MRPILRPGTHVLRRGRGELQVGLDPGSALVLPDSAAVRESLRLLGASADVASYAETGVVDLLADHRLLLDERELTPLLSPTHGPPAATAALARAAGDTTSQVRTARGRSSVQVRGFGHPAGEALPEQAVALLETAGLGEQPARRGHLRCALLVGVGEPDREHSDDWLRAGTPHLPVRLTEGRAVVGPLVVPGVTACLRCVDAHCTDADPAWPLLVRQYATASARDRGDGVPEPLDPLLATLALAWAVRDLATFVDGGRPTSWSATVTLHPEPGHLETRSWLRHPACPCTWD